MEQLTNVDSAVGADKILAASRNNKILFLQPSVFVSITKLIPRLFCQFAYAEDSSSGRLCGERVQPHA